MTNSVPVVNATTEQAARIQSGPRCVLPHPDVQRFLLETIESSSYSGKMSEFVSQVKHLIKTATIE